MATNNEREFLGRDGTEQLVATVKSLVDDAVTEIAVERARINTFTKLTEGSTAGDAELQDVRVGYGGVIYDTAGAAVRDQIGQLAREIGATSVEKTNTQTLNIMSSEWDNTISFRHIWYPFTANKDFTINSVSFKAKVNNSWIDASQNMYAELLESDGTTVLASGFCTYEWVDNATLCDFNIELNGEVKSGCTYYLHFYNTTRSFSFYNCGYQTVYTDEWLTTHYTTRTSSAGTGAFDSAGSNVAMSLACDMVVSETTIEQSCGLSERLSDMDERLVTVEKEASSLTLVSIEKTLNIMSSEWDNTISFRHLWYPFTANKDFTIKSVSFRALMNNSWIDASQNMYAELLESDGTTVLASGFCTYEWVDNATLCDFNIELNGEVKSGCTYYLHFYNTTRSFSFYYPNGATYSSEYLTTIANTRTGNSGAITFDSASTNTWLSLACDMVISVPDDSTFNDIANKVYNLEQTIGNLVETNRTELYVSPDYTSADEGFGVIKFNTMLDAYESVPYDNTNKYIIHVSDGTYTDMQTLYAGVDGDTYQGLVLGNHGRNNVVFESISNDPTRCIIEWDGGTGYTGDLTNVNVVNKCAFHVNGGFGWEIRGFKFVGKNLRYCFHSETNSKTSCLIENCIFEWNGKDCTDYNHKNPVVGMGGTYYDFITFKNCKFLNSESTMGVQWHDNNPIFTETLMRGAILRFEDCYFDGLDIMPRSTEANREMPFSLELVRCGGLRKIYPNIGGSATTNYWRATVESCLIDDDKFKDCDSTSTYTDLTELKA